MTYRNYSDIKQSFRHLKRTTSNSQYNDDYLSLYKTLTGFKWILTMIIVIYDTLSYDGTIMTLHPLKDCVVNHNKVIKWVIGLIRD